MCVCVAVLGLDRDGLDGPAVLAAGASCFDLGKRAGRINGYPLVCVGFGPRIERVAAEAVDENDAAPPQLPCSSDWNLSQEPNCNGTGPMLGEWGKGERGHDWKGGTLLEATGTPGVETHEVPERRSHCRWLEPASSSFEMLSGGRVRTRLIFSLFFFYFLFPHFCSALLPQWRQQWVRA